MFVYIFLCRPSGWDNLNKISILYENMHSCKAEDYYTDVIVPPPERKVFDFVAKKIIFILNAFTTKKKLFSHCRPFQIVRTKCKQKMSNSFY